MDITISNPGKARYIVDSIRNSLAAVVAINELTTSICGRVTEELKGADGGLDAYELHLRLPQQDLIATDRLEQVRCLLQLGVQALIAGNPKAAPKDATFTILENCRAAADRNVGAFWTNEVIHLHPSLSGGTLAKVRKWIEALHLVECEPRLLPELPADTTWEDVLRSECVDGAGIEIIKGSLDGYSFSKGLIYLRVGRKTVTISAPLEVSIREVIDQARDGSELHITVTVSREVLLPKSTYVFGACARGAAQPDLGV